MTWQVRWYTMAASLQAAPPASCSSRCDSGLCFASVASVMKELTDPFATTSIARVYNHNCVEGSKVRAFSATHLLAALPAHGAVPSGHARDERGRTSRETLARHTQCERERPARGALPPCCNECSSSRQPLRGQSRHIRATDAIQMGNISHFHRGHPTDT